MKNNIVGKAKQNISTNGESQYKHLQFVNFKDLDRWDVSYLRGKMKGDYIKGIFGKSSKEMSDNELRGVLRYFHPLISGYGNAVGNAKFGDEHLSRRIGTIDSMKKETLLKWCDKIITLNIEDVIKYGRGKIQEEKEKIEKTEKLYNDFESKFNKN